MTSLIIVEPGLRAITSTRCPACMTFGLKLYQDGDIRCTRIGCPDPDYDRALEASARKHADDARDDELAEFSIWLTDHDPRDHLAYSHARQKELDERRAGGSDG